MPSRSPISIFFFTAFLGLVNTTLAFPTVAFTDHLSKRIALSCNNDGGLYRPISEVQACVDYLFTKSADECAVSGDQTVFCQAGDTVITGSNTGKGGESSLCQDVAKGAQKIIDSCTTPEGFVGGHNAAEGNGALIVSIHHR
ncbi:hypothetical protein BDW72DRAFT_33941 [Aspergillus terricola var. indicus]